MSPSKSDDMTPILPEALQSQVAVACGAPVYHQTGGLTP